MECAAPLGRGWIGVYDLTNTFSYNPVNQITQLVQSNTLYSYTGNWNKIGTYIPNGLNQYTSINGNSVTYDNNGNLTKDSNDSARTYTYDMENRLVSTNNSGTSSFVYDPLGRLFQVTLNNLVTQFVYDGDALVAEYNNSNVLQRRYVHGDQVDDPWVEYAGSTNGANYRTYLLSDHQGSIIARVNGSGGLSSKLTYDSFGIPGTSNAGRFGYTGQISMPQIGLYYYKARFYSPTLGRFLQTDPVYYADNMNMYAYVGNDPINNTDPTGMVCEGTGDKSKCTIDQVNIGSRKEPNWVSRADGIKSGRITEKQLGKLEGNITKAYTAAQKLGDGTVTIKGTGDVKDISVSGNQIAGALGKATLRADNQKFFDRPAANAATSYANQTVTFNAKGLGLSNYSQMRTTVHEGMHLLSDTKVWNDNSKYRFKHQEPFGDAAEDVLQNSGYEE